MKVSSMVQVGLIIFGLVSAAGAFAQESMTTSAESSTATGASQSERADYKEFQQKHRRQRAQNKKWFSFGVCVGQNLAQQGVVFQTGQKLDASYKEYVKAAKATCKEQFKAQAAPDASPSPSPSVSPSPSPSDASVL
jgi:hypothetical protein